MVSTISDPYDTSMQLSNALIAFNNGGLFGVGLGNSTAKIWIYSRVTKRFYWCYYI